MTRNNDTSRDDDARARASSSSRDDDASSYIDDDDALARAFDDMLARRFRRCDMTIYRCVGNRVSIVDASSLTRRLLARIVTRDAS